MRCQLRPDEISYSGVLSCGHMGLVTRALSIEAR